MTITRRRSLSLLAGAAAMMAVSLPATAQQTADVFGIDWGGGLYFNYAFTILWIADVIWWWRAGLERYRARRPSIHLAVQIFFAFMFFNGAVVFASGAGRLAGIAAIAAVVLASPARRARTGFA